MLRIGSCTVLILLLSAAWGCAQEQSFSADELETEARTFMETYAQDLRTKDAEAVAARYNRSGAYFLGNGRKEFSPFDSIRARYLEQWQGPATFEWRDLSYEVLSSDAVLVAGKFNWGRGDSLEALDLSYTGLLTRQDGELRIRLEDESVDPEAVKEFICATDTTSP